MLNLNYLMKSLFIVLEGIDGCGKGEQLKKLHNYFFEKDKKNVILSTREPTYGKYGMKIRKHLKEDNNPKENAKLFLQLYTDDRKEHLDTLVIPFLQRETGEVIHIVLCDRYYHSTYAFQQAQENSFEEIDRMQRNFRKPDLTIILDIDPKIALSRMGDRGRLEKFEKLEFMKILRENYLKLKEQLDENIVIIDGSKSIEEVFIEVKENIEKLFD